MRTVALLRGIAPSGRNMSNAHLRGVVERLGFTEVGSVISSGNITFTAPGGDAPEARSALERRIEGALTADLGLRSRALVRSLPQLRGLAASDPFEGLTHSPETYLTVTFLRDPVADPAVLDDQPDKDVHVLGHDGGAAAILSVADNSEPGNARRYLAWLERRFGTAMTTRSWLTVLRVIARLEEGGAPVSPGRSPGR
ncbi:DUF1697 domain-containing protein [Propioniciclava coleopterorum]|nr:DUF1697 domain-containing protein [Propioniciclava coleopterorum]